MAETQIEWADKVWNPVTGCTKVSPGCLNCYAERMAKRLHGRCGYPDGKTKQPFGVTWHPERLEEPLRWRKPQRVFVCSMGDLFHEDVPITFRQRVFSVMAQCPDHTFMVLTKRAQAMFETVSMGLFFDRRSHRILPNVMLGVSVENEHNVFKRIPWLVKTPAARRFVSVEPMLGPVDIHKYLAFTGEGHEDFGVNWVICGGETGPGARPMQLDWARSLRDQCLAAGVPFFFKNIGGARRPKDGHLLDGKEWRERP